VITLLLAAALAQDAAPVTGLAWRWEDGAPRRYHLRAQVDSSEVLAFKGWRNADLQITGFDLQLVVTCVPDGKPTKRVLAMACEVDDASLSVLPMPNSVGLTVPVATDWAARVKQGRIAAVVGLEGGLRSFDLAGLDPVIEREQQVQVVLEVMSRRAFSALDVHLPKEGTAGAEGAWIGRSEAMFGLPSASGQLGDNTVEHRVLASRPPLVLVSFAGRGTISSGAEVRSGQLATAAAATLEGTAMFDVAAGELLQVQSRFLGWPTAGATGQSNSGVPTIRQALTLTRLVEGMTAPVLPPSSELSGFVVPYP
jgi:hypothetical protein